MKKKSLWMAVSLLLILSVAIGGTLAYLHDATETINNGFEKQQITVALTDDGGYRVLPGMHQTKTAEVSGTVDFPAYVFLKVEDKTPDYVSYSIDSGWTKLTGVEGVYYRSNVQGAYRYPIFAGNRISYSSALQLNEVDRTNPPTLTFTAFIIQQNYGGTLKTDGTLDGESTFTEAEAWALVAPQS